MDACFVIQPFDRGVFDKRYNDTFEPAIKAAGLEPYRVDRDPRVSIPIEDIEKGIRNSKICFAEITTDNPNVWFELGYAIASQKEVVLVCSNQRETRFPFDVQHRNIIEYKTDSSSDFDKLRESITERIEALVKKEAELEKIATISPIVETEGLSQHEMVALVTIMQNRLAPDESIAAYSIKNDMNKAGFTDIAVSISLTSLLKKGMLNISEEKDYNGEPYSAYTVTSKGEDWLLTNVDKLVLHKDTVDDIPF